MAKVIDITDKLSFDENPSLIIKGTKMEVNADAPTMLKVMNFMSGGDIGMEGVAQAYELVFPEESRNEIEKMKLSVPDWITVVEAAMTLITGDDESRGEE